MTFIKKKGDSPFETSRHGQAQQNLNSPFSSVSSTESKPLCAGSGGHDSSSVYASNAKYCVVAVLP